MKTSRKFKYQYAITVKNSSGVTEYCVISQYGIHMMENSYSLAKVFDTQKEAKKYFPILSNKYKGCNGWKLEYRKVFHLK